MIERRAERDGVVSRAWYSPCACYRYGLTRRWAAGPELLFVMLNPSTATETANDPTIERCQRRALRLGFGALAVANLFAFRATQPAALKAAEDPVGPETDALLTAWSVRAGITLAAWGVHGDLLGRARQVASQLAGDVRHLGLTRDGHPRHPLYVAYDTPLVAWPAEDRYAR